MNLNSLKIFLLSVFVIFSLTTVSNAMEEDLSGNKEAIARLIELLNKETPQADSETRSPSAKGGRGSSSESEGEKEKEKQFVPPLLIGALSSDNSAHSPDKTTPRTWAAQNDFGYISPSQGAPSPSILEGFDTPLSRQNSTSALSRQNSNSSTSSEQHLSKSPDNSSLQFDLDSEQSDPIDPSASETDQSTSERNSESDSDSDRKKHKVPSPIGESDSSDDEQRRVPTPARNSPDHFIQDQKTKKRYSESDDDSDNNDESRNAELLSDNLVSPELLGFLAGAGVIVGGYSAYTMNDTVKEKIDFGLTYLKFQTYKRCVKPCAKLWKKLQSEQPTRGDLARFALVSGYIYLFQKANKAFGLVRSAKKLAGNCFNQTKNFTGLVIKAINKHKSSSLIVGTGAVCAILWALSKYNAEKKPIGKRSYKQFMNVLYDSELQYITSETSFDENSV